MADETDNDTPDTEPDAPDEVAATADAAAEPAQADATDAEQAPAAGDDVHAETETPAVEAEPAPLVQAPPAEPVEQVAPKERRRRARSKHTEARPSRTPEERHAERLVERKTKAARRRARRLQERAKAATRRAAAPAPAPLAPVHAAVEGTRRVRQGIVVSDKAEKTITVRIDVARRHRRYEKIVRSSSTVHAHDENNDAHEGDTVRVIESRPLSRTKRWALVDVLERAR
jgi:small subunit ribosomal protein S17